MIDHLVAESAIRQLHSRCIDAVWRHDADAFADCYAEDGEWKIAGMRIRGRAEIRSRFLEFMSHVERVLMRFGAPILEIGEGTATGRTYVNEHNKFKDGRTAMTIGVYYERFVDQGDRWRFAFRHWDLYYIGPPDFSAPLYPVRDYGAPLGMPGPEDPTTVRKDFLFDAGGA